jgi:hypothetical protein
MLRPGSGFPRFAWRVFLWRSGFLVSGGKAVTEGKLDAKTRHDRQDMA